MSIHCFVVGRDGPPTSPLRGGQTGGGRVWVSFPCLCWGDPLQRSKIIRNTHFCCSSSHILLHSAIRYPPYLLSALPPFSVFFKTHSQTAWLNSLDISLFTKLDCEMDLSRQHVLSSTCSHLNLIPQTVFIQLHISVMGDLSEQTGAGHPTQYTWCWCSELPINLWDICGGK